MHTRLSLCQTLCVDTLFRPAAAQEQRFWHRPCRCCICRRVGFGRERVCSDDEASLLYDGAMSEAPMARGDADVVGCGGRPKWIRL